MATNTYVIKWLKDKLTGTRFFPITHIKAVRDDNNANLETLLGEKQDELVSGTNIKTVNNNSLVGSGNVTIPVPAKTSELINDSGFLTTGDIPEGAAASTTTPKMDGTASVGTEMAFARGDHRHPKDTSKQDVISDLAEIRAGAALGATALQSFTESDPTVPSWAKAESKPTYTASEVGAVPTARKVNGKALSADITLSASDVGALPSSTAIPDELADLSDDSTHRLVTDAEKSTWNGKGTYSKPSGGIPKTDLANAVQTSLGKADSAVQTETDPVFSASAASGITSSDITNWNGKTSNVGTITGITMNGASKGTSGVVNLGTVITAHQDISGKADKSSTVSTVTYNTTSKKITKTINGTTSDVVTAAKIVTDGGGITTHQDISGKADKSTTTTAGTYKSVTVNASGIVTGGTNPTTISGYGITDAKIENGVITLGSNTITPVTDVSGKADKSTTVSGVAYDTTNHKITKTINGTTTDVVTAETIVNDGGAMTSMNYDGRLAANGGSAVIPIGIYVIGRLFDGYEVVSLGTRTYKSLSGIDPVGVSFQWDESTYYWTITNTATSGYRYYKCLFRGA